MKVILSFILLLPAMAFGRSPHEVVSFALESLTNGNFEALLEVTDNAEKRKTEELISQIQASPNRKRALMAEYKLLQSYTIEDTAFFTNNGRELAVVSTRWVVKIPLEKAPKNIVQEQNAKSERVVYVDYMVENKSNLWKIISRRSL